MKFVLLASFALPLVYSRTSGELCRGTGDQASDGNWYCSEVRAITYRNISQSGVYNRTTSVNPSTGICDHETVKYGAVGPLTPLFGEVSMHLRGPMNVSQLAVYQLPGDMHALEKRNIVLFHNRRREVQGRETQGTLQNHSQNVFESQLVDKRRYKTTTSCNPRTITATVTVTDCESHQPINTATSVQNMTYIASQLSCIDPPKAVGSNTGTLELRSSTTTAVVVIEQPSLTSILRPAKQAITSSERDSERRADAGWNRVAYYTSAAPAEATGLSFLANLGDPRQSGTFDYAFGNSLSYVSGSGDKVTPKSTPFDGTLTTSEREIAVFSDKACDQDCSYWRPNATSHFGWTGASKAFFIEFQMDHYQNIGSDQGLISDAPAWWFLNAAIPRILQYGNDRNNMPCSCWSTGCGEFDAFEVLGNGEERAKSTLHRQGNLEGGDSNYFKRPVGRMMKFAVVWHYPNITARVLDDGFDFSALLSNDQIQQLVAYDADS